METPKALNLETLKESLQKKQQQHTQAEKARQANVQLITDIEMAIAELPTDEFRTGVYDNLISQLTEVLALQTRGNAFIRSVSKEILALQAQILEAEEAEQNNLVDELRLQVNGMLTEMQSLARQAYTLELEVNQILARTQSMGRPLYPYTTLGSRLAKVQTYSISTDGRFYNQSTIGGY